MNNEDVNDHRKQKLNDIINKITESQLLKIQDAKDPGPCHGPEYKIGLNPQARESDINKAMTIKELSSFATPIMTYKPKPKPVSDSDLPAPLGAGYKRSC